ncbi:hypothetical protein [Ureibacillus sp. GCM10028918]
MANLLLSKFETYLLDEGQESDKQQDQKEFVYEKPTNYEEYPPGFFSGL